MIWEADKSVFNYNDEDNDMDDDSESPFDVLRAVRMTSVGCDEEVAWKRYAKYLFIKFYFDLNFEIM